MRADNTHHLRKAAQRRARETRTRADDALRTIQASGNAPTVSLLARTAQVTRSWIYTQPDLLDAIHTASDGRARPRVDAILTPATTKSMRRRLELAHDRITELTQQNRDLQHQIAVLHGELRTARSNFPS
ncbi:transposase [Cellulosimicrobium sp. BIT-GX5]|uniref:Transposase n=2 Tax=Cellulosimicrobium composti TaxID=2672572 RepID=A0A6N7ZNH3_9MICO|nr:transposase [Cellulosimicrobium composti]